jgi:hypothetical protein
MVFLECPEAPDVAEQHSRQELSQYRRLADAALPGAPQQGGQDDDREAKGNPTRFVERARGSV